MTERVGFVGLGLMGLPMAQNILRAGYPLTAYNRSPGKSETLSSGGGVAAASLEEVAQNSDIIITMLPGPPEIREIIAGEGSLLEYSRPGSVIIDMSTSSPILARELYDFGRDHGVDMIDAPVSGADVGAIEGTLSIMVGGDGKVVGRVLPLLEVMGKSVTHVGDAGKGQTVKACNQLTIAIILQSLSEAMALGDRAGVEKEKIVEVLGNGSAASRVMEVKKEKILGQDFEPGGRASLHYKDLGIVLETARELGVPLPVTAQVDQMFASLIAKGRGEWDHSALITLLEDA